jgi:hypothetical protein
MSEGPTCVVPHLFSLPAAPVASPHLFLHGHQILLLLAAVELRDHGDNTVLLRHSFSIDGWKELFLGFLA